MHKASTWFNYTLSRTDARTVYLENMVLRELLHQYGIVFLPLNPPWVEGAEAREHRRVYPRDAIDVDTERTITIGQAFLTGMDYILRYLE